MPGTKYSQYPMGRPPPPVGMRGWSSADRARRARVLTLIARPPSRGARALEGRARRGPGTGGSAVVDSAVLLRPVVVVGLELARRLLDGERAVDEALHARVEVVVEGRRRPVGVEGQAVTVQHRVEQRDERLGVGV